MELVDVAQNNTGGPSLVLYKLMLVEAQLSCSNSGIHMQEWICLGT